MPGSLSRGTGQGEGGLRREALWFSLDCFERMGVKQR